MKKLLLTIFTFTAITSFSQTKKPMPAGYASLTAQVNVYDKGQAFGAAFNVGRKASKVIGIGAGMELLGFKNSNSPYAPVYGDLRFFIPSTKKAEAFFLIQPGYSFFNYSNRNETKVSNGSNTDTLRSSVMSHGGFYFSAGMGVKIKTKPSAVITLRFSSYDFNYRYEGEYFRQQKTSGRLNALALNFGIGL